MAELDKCPECGLYVNNIKRNGCPHIEKNYSYPRKHKKLSLEENLKILEKE